MGFSASTYNVKVPSMEGYSGNVQDYNYLDRALESVGINNKQSSVDTLSIENVNVVDSSTNPKPIDYKSDFFDGFVKAGATVATGVFSIVEGVGNFAESLVDAGTMLCAGLATPFTFIGDKIFGTNLTDKMWNGTKALVSKEHVKGWFDDFYENDTLGQAIKDNAYAFDTVRSVGNEVGYVAGVVALSVVTCGAGTVGLGAATAGAAASSAGGLSLSAGMGLIAGAAGFGKHTQKAWNEGASLESGLASGVVGGVVDGLMYYAGGKVAGLAPSLSAGTNSAIRIGADMALGAADGFIRPGVDAIASGKSYEEEFKESGGFQAVGIQTLMAGALSGLGELKMRNSVQFGGVKSKIKGEIDPAKRSQLLSEYRSLFAKDSQSHYPTVQTFDDLLSTTDNPEVLDIVSNLIETKKANPKFGLTTTADGFRTSFFSHAEDRINIAANDNAISNFPVAMHETGHMAHYYKTNYAMPNDIDAMLARTRVFNSNKGVNMTNDFIIESNKVWDKAMKLADTQLDDYFAGFGMTRSEYYSNVLHNNRVELNKMLNSQDLERYLKSIGIGDSYLSTLGPLDPSMITDDFVNKITDTQFYLLKTRWAEANLGAHSDYAAISDIVDGLYQGTSTNLKQSPLRLPWHHGSDYYRNVPNVWTEMVANYTQLKTTGSKRSITMLRQMVGDELVDNLDYLYQQLK